MSNETRKLPDRAGWWWYHDPSSPHGVCIYVGRSPVTGQMILDTTGGIVNADEVDGSWLAPIPGPVVCAALAEYGEAVDDLDALWDGADFITRNNVTNLAHAAGDALDAAIRAERDGAA